MNNPNEDRWNSSDYFIYKVSSLLRDGKVLLILGPDISSSLGLPSWHVIIQRLFQTINLKPPETHAFLREPDYFMRSHWHNDNSTFLDAITKALYSDFSPSIYKHSRNDILHSICSLILYSQRQGMRNIISFSLDDIIESYLQAQGLNTKSITDEWDWYGNEELTVYHPFGLLPYQKDTPRSSEVVLNPTNSFDFQYDKKVQFLLSQFKTHFCIFIGVSFFDDYLNLLINAASDSHSSQKEELPYWGLAYTKPYKDQPWHELLKDRGVFTQPIENYSELPDYLCAFISTNLYSVFISYGGPDEKFAAKINNALSNKGVQTFLFTQNAKPGQKLHRLMREGVNKYDRVVLICSQNSLDRPGVVNEIEETLQREAREGGESILIPITLDNYVFADWAPKHPDISQAIRDRVVADFQDTEDDFMKFHFSIRTLIEALNIPIDA